MNLSAESGDDKLYDSGDPGIPYVVVNGTIVVKHSKVLKDAFPGKAIRNPVQN